MPVGATEYTFIKMPYKPDPLIVDEQGFPSFAHSIKETKIQHVR